MGQCGQRIRRWGNAADASEGRPYPLRAAVDATIWLVTQCMLQERRRATRNAFALTALSQPNGLRVVAVGMLRIHRFGMMPTAPDHKT